MAIAVFVNAGFVSLVERILNFPVALLVYWLAWWGEVFFCVVGIILYWWVYEFLVLLH